MIAPMNNCSKIPISAKSFGLYSPADMTSALLGEAIVVENAMLEATATQIRNGIGLSCMLTAQAKANGANRIAVTVLLTNWLTIKVNK